jgi:D-glycero-D-manno-heptose 1,7-bisphosphate phosphatase
VYRFSCLGYATRVAQPGQRWQVDVVLCDRDGTLVADVPYNRDPARVRPIPGVRRSLGRLRAAGIAVGIVSNQSGVARGLLTAGEVARVNRRVAELLGPFDVTLWCPHGPGDGCRCRKPAPGMVHDAAARLGTDPGHCVVVGDIGADVEAAQAAGARGILVPTPETRPEEVAAADVVAPDFAAAVDLLLAATTRPDRAAPPDSPDSTPDPTPDLADRPDPPERIDVPEGIDVAGGHHWTASPVAAPGSDRMAP